MVLGLVNGPERRGPVGAHGLHSWRPGRAQRERQLGRQEALVSASPPPSPRCCQGTEGQGAGWGGWRPGLEDDSNLLTSTKERQKPAARSSHQAEAKASISPSPGLTAHLLNRTGAFSSAAPQDLQESLPTLAASSLSSLFPKSPLFLQSSPLPQLPMSSLSAPPRPPTPPLHIGTSREKVLVGLGPSSSSLPQGGGGCTGVIPVRREGLTSLIIHLGSGLGLGLMQPL